MTEPDEDGLRTEAEAAWLFGNYLWCVRCLDGMRGISARMVISRCGEVLSATESLRKFAQLLTRAAHLSSIYSTANLSTRQQVVSRLTSRYTVT